MPVLLPVHSSAHHSDSSFPTSLLLCPQAKWTFTLHSDQDAGLALPPEFSIIPQRNKPVSSRHSDITSYLVSDYLCPRVRSQKINQEPVSLNC